MKQTVLNLIMVASMFSVSAQQERAGFSFLPYQESVNTINCQKGLCGTTPLAFYQQIAVYHEHYGRNSNYWRPVDSTYNFFNDHQRDSANVTYAFSRSAGVWANQRRLVYTYDNAGIETASIVQLWDTANNAWHNYDQVLYNHNSTGQLSSYVFQLWDTAHANWLNWQETAETYNQQGNVASSVTLQWDTTTFRWMNQSRIVNSYNDQYKNDTSTESAWDGEQWVHTQRHVYNYDLPGNDTLTVKQVWDGNSGWSNVAKYSYAFNESSSPVSETDSVWNATKAAFVPVTKNKHTYDFVNNDTLYETFAWDSVTRGWAAINKTSYIFDENNNKTYELLLGYNNTTDSYDSLERYYYYYKSLNGVGGGFVRPDSISGITISPNYSNGSNQMVLTVSLDQDAPIVVTVYDMAGNPLLVSQRDCSAGINQFFLQLSSLNTGMYDIQVANTKTHSSSVVKLMAP